MTARRTLPGMTNLTLVRPVRTRLPARPVMEQAVLDRDDSFDGLFTVGVISTNIFCRPSCPARKPLRKNMDFYPTPKEALAAGFRPCKRCRPMAVNGKPPAWVTQLLERIEADPERRPHDRDLRAWGVDPVKARRWFLKHHAMTFHAYARARRLGKAFQKIRTGASLDDTGMDVGYESTSGFRDAFGQVFGTPPGKARHGECILTTMIPTPLGPLVAGATSKGLCLLEFTDRRMLEAQVTTLRRHFKAPIVPGSNRHLAQARRELKEYFAGRRTQFDVAVDAPGTDFQQQVWKELRRIPTGATRSYADIARQVGRPGAVRAVGTANGMNRIAIVIPCHRVVNTGGKLGGYGGGLWRKQALLELEGAQLKLALPAESRRA
jgi:AraC family transcriptional regulator of adaptative response/methylated-DNA-[protein]-cysteine methyltransferase